VIQAPWGRLELAIGCAGGEARHRSIEEGFGEGSLELTRLTVLDGLSCQP
jgi:hypothetical protein